MPQSKHPLLIVVAACLLSASVVTVTTALEPPKSEQAQRGKSKAKASADRSQQRDERRGEDERQAEKKAEKKKAEKKAADKKAADKEKQEENELQRGRILKRTYQFEAAGKEMEYALYVPKSFSPKKKSPLIVALHGLNSYPRQILGYPGFVRRAEKHGYILVAPMGYNRRGWYGSLGKGGGRRRSDPENLGELSEKDVLNVLELTRKHFPIDSNRIFLFGHSMGGGGAMHLAIKYPQIWAAMAPVAPAASRRLRGLEKAKHIPAIVIQGDKDRLVSARGTRRWSEKMKELGMEHRYIEVKDGDHVSVAFKYFDDIFEFFNKHPRSGKSSKKRETQKQ